MTVVTDRWSVSVWDDLTGQEEAVASLRNAAEPTDGTGGMTHSWLITGPPGSGRSNLAYAFAAALVGDGPEDEDAHPAAGAGREDHPDVAVLSTERVIITIDEIRQLVKPRSTTRRRSAGTASSSSRTPTG